MLFDTLQGRIDLAPTILFANRARRDIVADGVTLTNEIRQKNGWTHVTAGRFQSDGRPFVLSLSFLRDRLGKAHLFLEDAEAAGPEDLRRRHDDFLRSMLGPPDVAQQARDQLRLQLGRDLVVLRSTQRQRRDRHRLEVGSASGALLHAERRVAGLVG